MTLQKLTERLLPLYDRHEAQALLRILVEDVCGESWTHFIIVPHESPELSAALARLAGGEPIQHILGYADFCGQRFRVTPDTLIPRPETEELVGWIIDDLSGSGEPCASDILDIGTGSGCIAISLARALGSSTVTALDISEPALEIARANDDTGRVRFVRHDILSPTPPPVGMQDIIVSNPPYICHHEAEQMHVNVLDHDPRLALFVPDDDPLLFYRAIGRHALALLRPGGRLYFELNAAYADDTARCLSDLGYSDISVRDDRFGRRRMLRAQLFRR